MYYIAEVMAPDVIKLTVIIWVSPKVAPYSAPVIIPAKLIFFPAVAESGNNSNSASALSPVVNTSSIKVVYAVPVSFGF